MKNVLERALESDPSKVAGWLVAGLGAIAAFIASLSPLLDGVEGWGEAAFIVLVAALPKLATGLASLKAYKPSTVDAIEDSAYQAGQEVAKHEFKLARLEAAQKGKATKAMSKSKAEGEKTETSSSPKPKVVKRSKAKTAVTLNPKQSRTTPKS